MIPLAIIAAAWVIATAGSILYAWQQEQKKKEEDLQESQGDLFKGDLPPEIRRILDAPGLQSELSAVTTQLGSFERVAEPHTDLDYSRKITLQSTPEGYDQLTPGEVADLDLEAGQSTLEAVYGGPAPFIRDIMESPITPSEAASKGAGFAKWGLAAIGLAHTPGILAEAASLGQIESVTWTIMDLLNASGVPGVTARLNQIPYESALYKSMTYHYQNIHRPVIPAFSALPAMLARGLITAEDFLKFGGYHGYLPRWIIASWNSFLKLPGYRDLQIMRWRGLIDDIGFKDTLLRQGWHPNVTDELLATVWQIPGYQDLIKLMVREIITPDDFITWIGRQGYGPGWAGSLYDAHFVLPSFGNVIDALHRGLISEAEALKFIFWHDYQPTARPGIAKSDLDIMRGLFKTLIPRVDLRYAYRIGRLSATDLTERYRWLGYEEDAGLMAEIQIARATTAERGTLATQHLKALRQGTATEADVRARLKALGFPEASVDMMVEAEVVRRAIGAVDPNEEARVLSTAQVLTAYRRRILDRPAAYNLLGAQGWDLEALDILLRINEPTPEEEAPITAVKSAAAALYREGYMDAQEFEGILRAANYLEPDIDRIRFSEDLRYRLDFLKDLQTADIEAYRKDVLTLEDLRTGLINRGLSPERALALVVKEAYKKLPKGALA